MTNYIQNEMMELVFEVQIHVFNSLPNDKILVESKLKVFADDEIIVTQKWKLRWEGNKTLWK